MIISEACYGAVIAGRDADTSLALAFLAAGAAGFVGATAISYGPPSPPAGEADLIALHFLRALKRPGATIGAAFMAARMGMIRDTIAFQSTLDEDDQKTLRELREKVFEIVVTFEPPNDYAQGIAIPADAEFRDAQQRPYRFQAKDCFH